MSRGAMLDHPLDELAALKDLIPEALGPEALDRWRRTGAAALTDQGLYTSEDLVGDTALEDFGALDHLDARAEAELVAAIIVAAGNYARRGS